MFTAVELKAITERFRKELTFAKEQEQQMPLENKANLIAQYVQGGMSLSQATHQAGRDISERDAAESEELVNENRTEQGSSMAEEVDPATTKLTADHKVVAPVSNSTPAPATPSVSPAPSVESSNDKTIASAPAGNAPAPSSTTPTTEVTSAQTSAPVVSNK